MTQTSLIALGTGASQGIGKAAAMALAEGGHTAPLVARSAEKREAMAGACSDRAHAMPCDVTDPAAVDALFDAVRSRFGRLDMVFNNAGASPPATEFGDIDLADWRRILSVNLDGAFLVARGAFRVTREPSPKGGRIINNGSISARVPRIGSAACTASRAAITGLTRTVSLDGRRRRPSSWAAWPSHQSVIERASSRGVRLAFTPPMSRTDRAVSCGRHIQHVGPEDGMENIALEQFEQAL